MFGFFSEGSAPKTHTFEGKIGDDYSVTKVYNGGTSIQLVGWKWGVSKDDYLILNCKGRTTRYQVTEVKYFKAPYNMFAAVAVFSPRGKTT
jgi:hypothetical protein